jgi:hypothetical protein
MASRRNVDSEFLPHSSHSKFPHYSNDSKLYEAIMDEGGKEGIQHFCEEMFLKLSVLKSERMLGNN